MKKTICQTPTALLAYTHFSSLIGILTPVTKEVLVRILQFFPISVLLAGLFGCSHYSSNLPLPKDFGAQTRKNTAAAGILDRRGLNGTTPTISMSATKLLVEETRVSDVSGALKSDEFSLLLSQPIELAMAKKRVQDIGNRPDKPRGRNGQV